MAALDPFAVALAEIRGTAVLCEDVAGTVLFASDAWATMMDGDLVRTSPLAIVERMSVDEQPRAREKLMSAAEAGVAVEFQTRLAIDHRPGEWVSVLRVPVRSASGQLEGWVTAVTSLVGHLDPLDISGLERSVEDKESRLARMGAWELHVATGQLWWSSGIYEMFGRDPAEYEPTYEHFLETIHPADRDLVIGHVQSAFTGESRYDVRHRIVLPRGEVRFVRERAEVDRDESGAPLRLIGTVEDVTDEIHEMQNRRRATRALATLTKANAALVHAPDEESLLRQMCGAAVEAGGYPLAWYGRLRPDGTFEVQALNSESPAEAYLRGFNIEQGVSLAASGATWRTARSGESIVYTDGGSAPDFEGWRSRARDYGLRSSVSLPVRHEEQLDGLLMVYSVEPDAFDPNAVQILEELAQELGFGLGRLSANQRITGALEGTIRVLAATVELRDPYTAGHQARVSNLAAQIAEHLQLDESAIHGIRLAGLVHDIGKVTVPTEFLTRPGTLRPAELELIKEHAKIGEDLLSSIDFPWPIASIVGQHHERMDGSGYPRGLAGRDILVPSRIMAVADVVEAMSRFRPYREALGEDIALQEITLHRGVLFDADAVDACIAVIESGFAFEGPT